MPRTSEQVSDPTGPVVEPTLAATDEPADDRAVLRTRIEALLRLYTSESQRLGQAFAEQQRLHRTDLHAIIHLHNASGTGEEITAGALATHLGLSSGATTALIDRLERVGHVTRSRGATDRRRVTLRFARSASSVAHAFFRPLGRRSAQVMEEFSDDELRVIARFLSGMTEAVSDHRRSTVPGEPAPEQSSGAPDRPA